MKNLYWVVAFVALYLAEGRLNGTSECGCKCQNGRDGRDGRDGVSIQGPAGRDGTNGADGRDCIDCARGPKGDKGATGARGHDGAAGAPGLVGAPGPKGNDGSNGSKGEKGQPGPKGDKGAKGDKGVCDSKAFSSLQKAFAELHQEMVSVKSESDKSKREVDVLNNEITGLLKQIEELKKSTVQLAPGRKLDQKLLPGGYSDFSVTDLQWHSMHLTAAAACRATSGSLGEPENEPNRVFARSSGKSCLQVCEATAYKGCDSELSLSANVKKANSSKDELGWFANKGCKDDSKYGEPSTSAEKIMNGGAFVSYCCCHRVKK